MKNKTKKFNSLGLFFVLIVIMKLMTSCGGSTSNQPATKVGFTEIENELVSKFGKNAYYTDLSITYNQSIGNIVGVTVTEAPESLKMGQWNLTQDTWQQNSDITIEVPTGTKASDYMFQLGEILNLSTLGGLVEKSVEKLKMEKKLENPTLSTASVFFPDNGDVSKAEYFVNLQPENGGTTFRFRYSLNGNLISMNY